MNLQTDFSTHFNQNFSSLFNSEVKLIVAVSGGIDSVVLCDVLHKYNFDFIIAHCNFNLRGEESTRDEKFVEALAKKYNKKYVVKHFNTNEFATNNKLSIQVAARQLRYEWFKSLQSTVNLKLQISNNYLATAHHRNDNIETVLFNFFRGTGINGLTGIAELDESRKIIRPLLNFSKEDILEYATNNKIEFVEDSSNSSNKYTRNSFRNEIIPIVKKHFIQAEDNILNTIKRLNDVANIYNAAIQKTIEEVVEKKGEELHIPILKLKKVEAHSSVLYEIIKTYGFAANQLVEVEKLLDAENSSYLNGENYRIIKNRNWLIIVPKDNSIANNIIVEKGVEQVEFDNKSLNLQILDNKKDVQASDNKNVETLDATMLEFPLVIRKWKVGDYFYPLGLGKKQKLSKFFINQKLSLQQKENVWVVESNKKIVWIMGYRIDDRYKLTATTKAIAVFEVK